MEFPIYDLLDRLEAWDGAEDWPTITSDVDACRMVLRMHVGRADVRRLPELEAMVQAWCGGRAALRPELADGRLTLVAEIRRPRRTRLPAATLPADAVGARPAALDPCDDSCRAAVLAALQKADRPLDTKGIARLARQNPRSSRFRAAMSALKKNGVIVRPNPAVREYWLASRPIP